MEKTLDLALCFVTYHLKRAESDASFSAMALLEVMYKMISVNVIFYIEF